MKAADVMVSPVIVARPDESVQQAAARLLDNRISGMPVVDDAGSVVGIISEGDLMRRVEIGTEPHRSWWLSLLSDARSSAASFVKAHARRVDEIMTRNVISVSPETSVGEIASLLESNGIKRAPVIDNGRLVGIVSRANLLQALASGGAARAGKPEIVGDAPLRDAVLRELKAQPWCPALLNVTVHEGVVDLWGLVDSETEKSAARVAAETIPGVRSVKDNLVVRRPGFEA